MGSRAGLRNGVGVSDGIEVPASLIGVFVRPLALIYAFLTPLWALGLYVVIHGSVPRETAVPVILGTAALVGAGVWLLSAATTAVSVTTELEGVTVVLRTARPLGRRRIFVRWSDLTQKVVFSPFYGSVALVSSGPPKLVLGLTFAQAKAVLRHPMCPIRNLPPVLDRRLDGS